MLIFPFIAELWNIVFNIHMFSVDFRIWVHLHGNHSVKTSINKSRRGYQLSVVLSIFACSSSHLEFQSNIIIKFYNTICIQIVHWWPLWILDPHKNVQISKIKWGFIKWTLQRHFLQSLVPTATGFLEAIIKTLKINHDDGWKETSNDDSCNKIIKFSSPPIKT